MKLSEDHKAKLLDVLADSLTVSKHIDKLFRINKNDRIKLYTEIIDHASGEEINETPGL